MKIERKTTTLLLIILLVLIIFPFNNSTNADEYAPADDYDSQLVDGNGVTWYIKEITAGSSNWTAPDNISEIDVLVIGGGGGSGRGTTNTAYDSGGGGAGGLIWIQNYSITAGANISYSIGGGGAGSTSSSATGGNGGSTVFGDLQALGGGGGGSGGSSYSRNGASGGSGGGGTRQAGNYGNGGLGLQPSQDGLSGIYGYGNDGAKASSASPSAGGGGAGGAGGLPTGGAGMNFSDYFGTDYGDNGTFASGGGGNNDGIDAIANTGMGGRARATNDGGSGRDGGSGIILIRWYYGMYIENESPSNGSINLDFDSNFNWSIYVYNSDGNTTSGSIECSNGNNMSWTDQPNGTRTLNLPNLVDSTTYTIWVNATDGTIVLNRTFWFQTIMRLTDEQGMTWTIYQFLEGSDVWNVPDGVKTVDALVVAGGGGSGKGTTDANYVFGGGGGAGGLIWYQNYPITTGSISYSIGNGGAGAISSGATGDNGEDSIFGDLVAMGGGGGGAGTNDYNQYGHTGGSGGGSGHPSSSYPLAALGVQSQMIVNGYGNDGGISYSAHPAGGGGAGGLGGVPAGGAGMDFSDYFGSSFGNSGWFASGGGGNNYGDDALPNSGMGGRAPSRTVADDGRDGGSGIILLRVSMGTQIYDEHPADNSIVDIYIEQWQINISHINGNTTNGTIECSNGDDMSWTNQANGTRTLTFSSLGYNEVYTIYVNVTDEDSSINKTYKFYTPDIYKDIHGVKWLVANITINNTNATGKGIWERPFYASNVDILVVGGGGGAGRCTGIISNNDMAGGGGAGGLIWIPDYAINDSYFNYEIGTGGMGGIDGAVRGENGDNTTFKNLTALGGGAGGGQDTSEINGADGASGGGGGVTGSGGTHPGGSGLQTSLSGWSGTYGYGNDGAPGIRTGTSYGGGGGGAGSKGGGTYWIDTDYTQLPQGGEGMDMSEYFGIGYGYNGVFAMGGGSATGPYPYPDSGLGGRAPGRGHAECGYVGSNGVILIRWHSIIYETNYSIINKTIVRADAKKWEIDLFHYLGNTTSGSIECSNGDNMSWTDQANGTRTLTFSSLGYNTIYTIWLNVTDGEYFFNESYWFKASDIYNDSYTAIIDSEDFSLYVYEDMIEMDILTVGGGGGSGRGTTTTTRNAGGGGAGGVVWIQNMTFTPFTVLSYSIGDGGAGSTTTAAPGSNGEDTTFENLTALGGGGGGSAYAYSDGYNAVNGGSGGGGGRYGSTRGSGGTGKQPTQDGWSGTYGYGNDGADGAGGGGGANSDGVQDSFGGDGINLSDYFGTSYGNNGIFASGGGAIDSGIDAIANTGMGGRARGISDSGNGRDGGSGVIMIRWTTGVVYSDEQPANNSENVSGWLTNWSIYVYHENVDNSSGTIECSNGDDISWNDEGNGRKTLTFTGYLNYNTTFYVWVNTTYEDNGVTLYNNQTFNFKTTTCKITGNIIDIYDNFVTNVKVTATGTPTYITYTDENGDYVFDDVIYGVGITYNITASKFAYTFTPEYIVKDLTRNVSNVNFTGEHYFYEGSGTVGDPFTIRNCTHLDNIRLFYNYTFVLYNDIDMSDCNITTWNGGKGFEPICDEAIPFNGTFDGGGHTISNLFVNYSDLEYVGLFGYASDSDIRNLGLLSANITLGNYTGGLIGYANNTTIQNCFINLESIIGNNYTGGLIGGLDNSTLDNAYARINISGSTFGGLVGINLNSLINHTYSTGNATGGGGLIGDNQGTVLNGYFDNETSGTTTSDGGIGYNTTTMTSLSFWQTTNFSFPDIWFYDQNQNDKYPILSIFTTITPPLLRDINNAGSLTQQISRYLNSSYNAENYCFFNVTAYVPQERYAGRWNKNVSDSYFIATGIEESDWTDTKEHYVIATRVTSTYTGYYEQMRVFTIWHGHYPSTLGCSIYSDVNDEPGQLLGYTDAWNFPIDRDSIWFPDYSHVWLTLNLTSSVFMTEGTSYWLLLTTNDSSMWRESYSMGWGNLSGMSDYVWALGNTIGDTSNVKMLPYNVTLNIPNKEYINGAYGYWRGDVQNSTFSWPASFSNAGWEQGKDITNTNLSQILLYALCSVDISFVDISNVTMTWGTGYEESIVWDDPVEMSRVSTDMNYWEYNKTSIVGEDWNTFKITLYDEFGNVESYDYYRWMKHGETERIYFQCNITTPPEGIKYLNSTTDLYSGDWVFYIYEAYYDDTPDIYGDNEGRKQALRHEQGVDGSAYDTGYWTTERPTDLYQERTCAFFVGGVWDQDVVIPDNITIDNAFVSWWIGSGRQLVANSTGAAQNIHWGRADIEASFDEFYIDDYGYGKWEALTYNGLEDTIAWQDMPLTRRQSNDWINFNESTWYNPPFFDNSTGRVTNKVIRQVVQKLNFSLLAGTNYPNTFDSNSIYQLFTGIDYDAMWASGANAILANNISHPSFMIFNVPDDNVLCSTDSNNDGITDYEELYLYGLQPFLNDTDNDSFSDIQELSRDAKANLYRNYPTDTDIILIKNMNPFKDNHTNEWATTLSVTIEHPQGRTMDLKWYVLRNYTFNSSYINQDQLLEGTWELVQTNASISNGTYTMDYSPMSENYWAVNVTDSSDWWGNRSSDFTGPHRQLNGTIFRDGGGLEDVNVTVISNKTGTIYYNLTDSDGYYVMTIPDGDYVITPILSGYSFIPYNKSITINLQNYTFNFTSIDVPEHSQEYPYNNTEDVTNNVTWSVLIYADYELDWSIECSDGNSSSDTNDVSGRKNLSLSNLSYDTWYTVWVNSSNSSYSHIKTNGIYYFKVREQKTDYPGLPIDFTVTFYNSTQINITWTKGANATNTYIRYASGATPPVNRSSGTFLYNNTGNSTSVSGLTENTTYSFSAWSWNETWNSWSYMVIATATPAPNYLEIDVDPNFINFGSVNIGEYAQTSNYFFQLTNTGMMCDVTISIGNTQNWTFVNLTDLGKDVFSVNWSDDNWASENNVHVGGSYLTEGIDYTESYDFDIKVYLATSVSHNSAGESFTITFTATAV